MKKRDLVIDADHILYLIAPLPPKNSLGGQALAAPLSLKVMKKKFNLIVKEIEDKVAVETVSKKFKLGETILIFSDPVNNFRKELHPGYKAGRPKQSEAFYTLRKHVHRKHTVAEGCEADDVVAYYVRNGAVGVSTDKDLLKGVKGRWYDNFHNTYCKTLQEDAERFTLMQTLAGDPTDKIPGLPRVGLPTAEKLLNEHGWDWNGVCAVHSLKDKDEAYATVTRQLIGMDEWTPEGGVVLWKQK